MLEKITLSNFRCFDNHEVKFKSLNIIVGKNNAGKSTLIEALRLISIVVERYRTAIYKDAPNWTRMGRNYKGISPSLQSFNFTLDNICHKYSEPPAEIIAYFENGGTIEIFIHDEESIFAVLKNEKEKTISSRSQAQNFDFPDINTLPQIGPLLKIEDKLESDYVKKMFPHH